MGSLIFGSTSCGRYQRHGLRHCGEYIPCLIRRAAFLKAGLEDNTENGYCVESLKGSDSPDVAAAAMACIEVQNHGIERFVKSALSFCDSTERNRYLGVVSRGLGEIRKLLMEHDVL